MVSSAARFSSGGVTARSQPSRWIISPFWDTACFLAPPVLALMLMAFLDLSQFDSAQSVLLVLAIISAGHHLPGFLRAYGDPELMARYRGRMLLGPPLLIGATLLIEFREMLGVQVLMLVWGVWHLVMQDYGLLRIYGAKKSEPLGNSALLDWLLVFTWIAAIYLNSQSWLYHLLWHFYDFGLPFLPDQAPTWLAEAALVAAIVSSVIHLWSLIRRIKTGQPISLLKYALLGSNVVFFALAFELTNSLLMVGAIVELLHDLQYYAIGWSFQSRLAAKQQNQRPLLSLLFRPRPIAVLCFLSLCVGYGALLSDYGRTYLVAEGVLFRTMRALLAASTIFHFYSDGFIWKVRQPRVRQCLGIEGESSEERQTEPTVKATWGRSLMHMACYAMVLALVIFASSVRSPRHFEIAEHLVQAFPQLGTAHHNLGFEYQKRGQNGPAIRELLLALQLGVHDPVELRQRLAFAFQSVGEFERALTALREAVEIAPPNKVQQATGQLAQLLAECPNPRLRDGPQAVRLAELAVSLGGPMRAVYLEILVASYQSVGRIDDARKAALSALEEARHSQQPALVERIASRLGQLGPPESATSSSDR